MKEKGSRRGRRGRGGIPMKRTQLAMNGAKVLMDEARMPMKIFSG